MTIQQQAWRNAKREVKTLTDKLAMPVDPKIIETVAVLRLLGFTTVASCGGHVRRTTSGPYVMIEAPKAQSYAALAREIKDVRSNEYRQLRQKANYFRALDLQRLSGYLECFYHERQLNYDQHLIVQSMPMTLNILKCHGQNLPWLVIVNQKK